MSDLILKAENLFKSFNLEAGFFAKKDQLVYAVNDISFDLRRGETLGIVGESGCGKSTTARMLVRMYEPTSGRVLYYPKDQEASQAQDSGAQNIFDYKRKALNEYRRKVKYVFQDPARSLNPRMSAFNVLTDAFKYSPQKVGKEELRALAEKTFLEVGLAERHLDKRPSEFSGGQRQRVSIARALIMNPELLICDEVVSALDVSIQGQILNLLQDLRAKKNLSFVFITHDLKVAGWFCDRIAVMYRGAIVEEAPAATLFQNARHPYTKLLFDGAQGKAQASSVEVTSVLSKENGCPFAHRCPHAKPECLSALPPLRDVAEGHRVRCVLG
ncbi:MAG: ABC transporter ATP-binding protein [Treponema sp.]|nr:ABC transporter ATP-binding protein [Treponema sp.]